MSFFAILALLAPANAQFTGFSSPQGVVQKFTMAGGAQVSANIQDVGQTFHTVSYTVTGGTPNQLVLRIDGGYDGVNFQAISDDATNGSSGLVVAIGYYPFLRVNLVSCAACGAITVTANYSGTSSVSGLPNGAYNPAQLLKKTAFVLQSDGTTATSSAIVAPYGSSAGVLVVEPQGGAFPASSTVAVLTTINAASLAPTVGSFILDSSAANLHAYVVPATPATTVQVVFTSGGASANSFTCWYFFYPPGASLPGAAQPGNVLNTESVSATNAAVSKVLTPTGLQTAYIFSVSAHCSAGTSGINISIGGTNVWTSGANEVTTATFRYQWNPGYAAVLTQLGSPPNQPITINLATCGVGNVGTLDVQASVF